MLNKSGGFTSAELKAAFANHQAHHIIPVNLIAKSDDLRTALKWGAENEGFDFNSIDNLIYLSKNNHSGSHPDYDIFMEAQIGLRLDPSSTSQDNFEELKELIHFMKNDFSDKVIGLNIKINAQYGN